MVFLFFSCGYTPLSRTVRHHLETVMDERESESKEKQGLIGTMFVSKEMFWLALAGVLIGNVIVGLVMPTAIRALCGFE